MAKPIEALTIRTARLSEIDALATAMDRSRNDIINQAIDAYLATNQWQLDRIKAGIAAAREADLLPADCLFETIAAKHGWSR